MTEEWNREKSLLLDRITELEDRTKSTRSCSTCIHQVVCPIPTQFVLVAERVFNHDKFNQMSKDIREFLGSKCPHYWVEEIDDE